MKGVTYIRVSLLPHAYCTENDGERACTFERYATHFPRLTAQEVRNEAQRHVQRTGHVVRVDVVDSTEYSPENAPAEAVTRP